jgi:hypothetical protein
MPTLKTKTKRKTTHKYGPKAVKKIGKVMHEWGTHKLHIGTSKQLVKDQKQAIAIGISEARREGDKVPKQKNIKK